MNIMFQRFQTLEREQNDMHCKVLSSHELLQHVAGAIGTAAVPITMPNEIEKKPQLQGKNVRIEQTRDIELNDGLTEVCKPHNSAKSVESPGWLWQATPTPTGPSTCLP